jgi:hypothetical protein
MVEELQSCGLHLTDFAGLSVPGLDVAVSMWEDFIRRRPTEVDHLQGAIVRLADRHGVEAPLSKRVLALVKQAEAAGAGPPSLTPEQIRQARRNGGDSAK